jgi:amino acid transporter
MKLIHEDTYLLLLHACIGTNGLSNMACEFYNLTILLIRIYTGALAYAELGTMNTSSGAEYAYFMDAFGGPPAFLFSWVMLQNLTSASYGIYSTFSYMTLLD